MSAQATSIVVNLVVMVVAMILVFLVPRQLPKSARASVHFGNYVGAALFVALGVAFAAMEGRNVVDALLLSTLSYPTLLIPSGYGLVIGTTFSLFSGARHTADAMSESSSERKLDPASLGLVPPLGSRAWWINISIYCALLALGVALMIWGRLA